jgi:hypothetical protein
MMGVGGIPVRVHGLRNADPPWGRIGGDAGNRAFRTSSWTAKTSLSSHLRANLREGGAV